MAETTQWLKRSLTAAKPHFVWQSSARVALLLGGPFFVGAATGYLSEAMWVSFAAMFFAAGEKPGVLFQDAIRKTLFVAPFSCLAFFTGYLSDLLTWAQFLMLAVIAFLAGTLATWNGYMSAVAMQVLMITSMVTGMSDRPYARYALFFAIGAALYVLGVFIQGVFTGRESEVSRLNRVISTLADNCQQRAQALRTGKLQVVDGAIVPTEESDRAVAAYASAFAAATSPEFMGPRYWDALEAIDLVEAEAWDSTDPQKLEDFARHLHGLVSTEHSDAKEAQIAQSLASLYAAHQSYQHSAETTKRTDVLPGRSAFVAAKPHRWTPFSITSGLRLSLCFSVGLLAGFLLPMDHVFWVATTVAMVMTPNMSAVVTRALQRCVGAVVGVGLATLLLWIDNSNYWLAACITMLGFALPWIGSASAIYKQFFMVPIILLFGDIIIPGAHDPQFYGPERLLGTVVGGVIVFVFGYLLWPAVRRPEFDAGFSSLQQQLVQYMATVTDKGTSLESSSSQRHRVYSALSTFQQKLKVAAAEPPPTSTSAQTWFPVLLASGRVCDENTKLIEEGNRLGQQLQPLVDQLAAVPITQTERIDAQRLAAEGTAAQTAAAIRHLNRRVLATARTE